MMELSEFSRRRRAIAVPLTFVPVVAAIAGGLWASTRPAAYRYGVEIQIPAPVGQSGAAALEENVSTYRSLVGSAQVTEAVSRQTGVRAGAVHDALTTERPRDQRGGLVRVVYLGTNRSAAPAIARDAAIAAVGELMRPSLDSARAALSGAQTAAGSARQALAAAAKKYGGLPIEEYRSLQNQIARLEADRSASHRPAADLDGAIREGRKRLSALTPRVIEVQGLQDQLGQADRTLADAQQEARTVQARLAAAGTSIGGSSAAVPVARGPVIVRTVAMCAGVGVLLAVGIIALVELLRRGPRAVAALPQNALDAADHSLAG